LDLTPDVEALAKNVVFCTLSKLFCRSTRGKVNEAGTAINNDTQCLLYSVHSRLVWTFPDGNAKLLQPNEPPLLIHDQWMLTMRTSRKLHEFLGIELPIIQAPMAGVQGSALAVSVCNAGGLGSLPGAMLGPDALRKELAEVAAQTRQPYNVNFFCHVLPRPDPEREAAWRKILAPYYREA
jgi:hypothetical protein